LIVRRLLGLALAALLLTAPTAHAQTSNGSTTNFVTATYTNASTTFSSINNLSFPVSAGSNYYVECELVWQGSAGTAGAKYQWTGPAAPSAVVSGATFGITATTNGNAAVVAFSSAMANTGTITTATNFHDVVRLSLMNGVNGGTVQLQAAANGVGTLTIQPGSSCAMTPSR
jgi:hypothetical protein